MQKLYMPMMWWIRDKTCTGITAWKKDFNVAWWLMKWRQKADAIVSAGNTGF